MKNARQILVKNGVHIGTQRKVADTKRFIFKIREDGLAILNVQDTIDRLRTAAKFFAKYPAEEVLVVASKEQAWRPVQKFAEFTGFKCMPGRFMPGTMTNPNLEYFIEPSLLITVDPYGDRQAISEAIAKGIPVITLASTNNTLENIDLAIPCNNKGRRSLAAVYWLLTNYVLYERGELKENESIATQVEEFVGDVPDEQE
ncbi:MAG: 30S ribosomal protein S2 [Candidatus Altiarchaeota archaeon]|nr:30S ribosomal protein S2 [Candidatus Altiarchaeota archaeon]